MKTKVGRIKKENCGIANVRIDVGVYKNFKMLCSVQEVEIKHEVEAMIRDYVVRKAEELKSKKIGDLLVKTV